MIELLLVILIGVVVGFLGALLGIGGGIILVPTFVIFLNMNARVAIATSLASLIATSAMSSSVYVKKGLTDLKLAVFLELTTVIGALVGANIAIMISPSILEIIFGSILIYASVLMVYRTIKPRVLDVSASSGSESYFDEALNRIIYYHYKRLGLTAGLSFLAGFASGLLGIGGGIVKVPLLDLVADVPMKVAIATSSYMIGITASMGTLVYFFNNYVRPDIVAMVIIGIIIGSRFGTFVMGKLKPRILRLIFTSLLLYYSYRMIIKGLGI